MKMEQNRTGDRLTVALSGRIDSVTAPELDAALDNWLDGVCDLVLDFKELEYTSSAGLRVLLKTQKRMKKQGKMKLINVCSDIIELLELTGFTKFITVEPA